jgi:hypothetical protein
MENEQKERLLRLAHSRAQGFVEAMKQAELVGMNISQVYIAQHELYEGFLSVLNHEERQQFAELFANELLSASDSMPDVEGRAEYITGTNGIASLK